MDEGKKADLDIELNRQILRYLAKSAGKNGIDSIDKRTGNTVLMHACELLNDFVIIETIVNAGADVNAVNLKDEMPLTFIKKKRVRNCVLVDTPGCYLDLGVSQEAQVPTDRK